jgi:hypothetical protein
LLQPRPPTAQEKPGPHLAAQCVQVASQRACERLQLRLCVAPRRLDRLGRGAQRLGQPRLLFGGKDGRGGRRE